MIIDVPNSLGYPIHFQNSDKSRLALIMPYNATGEKIKKVKWNVLDTDGNVVYTTSSIQEAEIFGLTTKMIEDK